LSSEAEIGINSLSNVVFISSPELLNANSLTITARNEANRIFAALVDVDPTLVAAAGAQRQEQFALDFVERLIGQLLEPLNAVAFLKQFRVTETVNTVLHHEIFRMIN
jgi:hypothetical protein